MSLEEAKWHWAEGMKYVVEGAKLLFLLNGAGCVSILTFIGNMKAGSNLLIWSMLSFGLGAATRTRQTSGTNDFQEPLFSRD